MRSVLRWLPTGVTLTSEEFRVRHRLVLAVLWLNVPVLLSVGAVNHLELTHTLVDVLPVVALALVATAVKPRLAKSVSASVGLLAASAVLIHLSGGMVEAHFHIFVVLVFVALYQDWRTLGIAIAFTVAHHIGMSVIDGHAVFDHPAAQQNPILWALIHAAFVVVEVFAILAFWRVTEAAQEQAQAALAEAAEHDRARLAAERELVDRATAEANEAQAALARRAEAAVAARSDAGELATTMGSVSDAVSNVASAMQAMATSISDISQAMGQATNVTAQAVERANTADRTVTQLGASSTEIGTVLDVITQIAAQTNLLALNATIEAARAGDAGRGFAVVANEVKELARQTTEAAVSIGTMVDAIRAEATNATEDLRQVVTTINEIEHIQTTVAAAVTEQSATTNEVSRETDVVATRSEAAGQLAGRLAAVVEASVTA
jgi:methyl-accepting chemotaxis protein